MTPSVEDKYYAAFAAAAEPWMHSLEGTGLLARNRGAFERSMRSRARAAADAQAAREAALTHTKRVHTASTFVHPLAAAAECAAAALLAVSLGFRSTGEVSRDGGRLLRCTRLSRVRAPARRQ